MKGRLGNGIGYRTKVSSVGGQLTLEESAYQLHPWAKLPERIVGGPQVNALCEWTH